MTKRHWFSCVCYFISHGITLVLCQSHGLVYTLHYLPIFIEGNKLYDIWNRNNALSNYCNTDKKDLKHYPVFFFFSCFIELCQIIRNLFFLFFFTFHLTCNTRPNLFPKTFRIVSSTYITRAAAEIS